MYRCSAQRTTRRHHPMPTARDVSHTVCRIRISWHLILFSGKKSITVTGLSCIPWAEAGRNKNWGELRIYYPSHSFCRQPFHNPRPYGPYCFVVREVKDGKTVQIPEPCFPTCEDVLVQCVPEIMKPFFHLWLGPFNPKENSGVGCKPWIDVLFSESNQDRDYSTIYGFSGERCATNYWETSSVSFFISGCIGTYLWTPGTI